MESTSFAGADRALLETSKWPKRHIGVIGPRKSGVSVVLRAWSEEKSGTFLQLSQWSDKSASEIAAQLNGPVALDDAHASLDAEGLLTWINLSEERKIPIIIGGHGTPANWFAAPKDLVSRLSAMTLIELGQLTGGAFKAAIKKSCETYFIEIPDETLSFVELRLEQTHSAVAEFTAALNQAMAETGRSASIPLARDVLSALSDDEELSD